MTFQSKQAMVCPSKHSASKAPAQFRTLDRTPLRGSALKLSDPANAIASSKP